MLSGVSMRLRLASTFVPDGVAKAAQSVQQSANTIREMRRANQRRDDRQKNVQLMAVGGGVLEEVLDPLPAGEPLQRNAYNRSDRRFGRYVRWYYDRIKSFRAEVTCSIHEMSDDRVIILSYEPRYEHAERSVAGLVG
jgi:hypothetical protein